jgi:multiple sugar transport system permease protein
MRAAGQLRGLLRHSALIAVSALFAFPFIWLVLTSLKPDTQIFANPPVWIPHPIVWRHYSEALTDIPFARYVVNTLRICVINVAGTVLSCSLVAYGISRIPWKGANILFGSLIATMILPGQVTMVPTFMIFKSLGWIGTILPLTAPSFLGTAFYIFLLRQFFKTLPSELSDAARLDGCNELGIYARIILPLAKPALATVGLFAFMGSWNDFMGPLLYLNDDRDYTITMGLQRFVSQHGAEWGKLMAGSALMVAPVFLAFLFGQRYFVKGLAIGGSRE